MKLVLEVVDGPRARAEYPCCFRSRNTPPLPATNPPRYVLPGGRRLSLSKAEHLKAILGWELEPADTHRASLSRLLEGE